MERLKEISQKSHMRPFGAAFKYLLLNCTMNREVCKRTCLIGAFIQHLTILVGLFGF